MKKYKFISLILILLITLVSLWVKGCNNRELPKDPYITLYLHEEKRTIKLRLEEYIVGTVAAEMPASFELEALKAQAVCARTYALRKLLDNRKYAKGADLSDDISTCQAYISKSSFQKLHPLNSEFLWDKIKKAVNETKGIVILYDKKPIDALYHSTCGGRTAGAEEAWGNIVPYLKSVKCDYCKTSRYYTTTRIFSDEEIKEVLKIKDLKEIKIAKTSQSGRAVKIALGDNFISASDFRSLLDLPSTWFKFNLHNKRLTINSRGYGHGVGLCQYGANGMAKEGKNYKQILNHYYTNIELYKIKY